MKHAKSYWRIILVAWSPLLIGAAIYGTVYGVRYIQANNIYTKDHAEYSTCMGQYNKRLDDYQKHRVTVPGGFSGDTLPMPVDDCYQPAHIRHGFLWLPEYGVN